jgi:hypothetical protein
MCCRSVAPNNMPQTTSDHGHTCGGKSARRNGNSSASILALVSCANKLQHICQKHTKFSVQSSRAFNDFYFFKDSRKGCGFSTLLNSLRRHILSTYLSTYSTSFQGSIIGSELRCSKRLTCCSVPLDPPLLQPVFARRGC